MGYCRFYLVHLDSNKLLEVTFFVAIKDGRMLLSCKTTQVLGLIQPRSILDYLSPRASLITSSVYHPKKTMSVKVSVHWSRQEVATQSTQQQVSAQTAMKKQDVSKLITSREQILTQYPNVFDGIGKFPSPPYNIQLDPSIPPKQTPCCPVPVHLKENLTKEIDKILKTSILKPVHQATLWINSFVLVECKVKLHNLKLHIGLDPTNCNKAII